MRSSLLHVKVSANAAMRGMLAAALVALASAVEAGCSSAPAGTSTRLQLADLNETADRMAQSLASSPLLAQRGPDSQPLVVVINRVENLTTDIITPAEQWMLMSRVRSSLPLVQLASSKRVYFQLEPERYQLLREAGHTVEPDAGRPPTHVMRATFRSSPRLLRSSLDGQVQQRQEYYYLEYVMEDMQTREVVWTDRFEFKREARGLVID